MQGAGAAGEAVASPVDWGGMLDRLAQVITPQEDAAVRSLASNTTIPPALLVVRMHYFMSGLLVGHGITTWQQLCPNLPGDVPTLLCLSYDVNRCSVSLLCCK